METINRRPHHHHDSSSMSGILAPEARKPPAKDYHRENIQMMHAREQEIQRKREEEIKKTQSPPE